MGKASGSDANEKLLFAIIKEANLTGKYGAIAQHMGDGMNEKAVRMRILRLQRKLSKAVGATSEPTTPTKPADEKAGEKVGNTPGRKANTKRKRLTPLSDSEDSDAVVHDDSPTTKRAKSERSAKAKTASKGNVYIEYSDGEEGYELA